MPEGYSDDDEARKRGIDRKFQPNQFYKMKEELKKKVNSAALQKEKQETRKSLMENKQKIKDEMAKKGIATADAKADDKNMIKDQERKTDADKATGTTEQGAKAP